VLLLYRCSTFCAAKGKLCLSTELRVQRLVLYTTV
jgi:hypothetical protein